MLDITYIQDKMFTRFMPESKAGEDVWRQMHDQHGTQVFNFEADRVIAEMRKAGYSVGKANSVTAKEIDFILAELGMECDICGDYHDEDVVPFTCQTGDGI